MINANEQLGTGEDGIASLATPCNFTDIHAHHHKGINNMATYARGTKRINFILVTKNLVEKTTASGFLAFYDGIELDHRGIFVDFDENKLLRDKTPTMQSHAQRILSSKCPKIVKQYKEELWKRLNSQNICERSNKSRSKQAYNNHYPTTSNKNLTASPT
jgi:hypothetical protein